VRVLTFEEHSSSLVHWWRERTHPRTVIYLDAHLDLQFVNDERLHRLQDCTSAQQVEALGKPHHLQPDGPFSYSLENFLFPAARLGLIDRLVWVAPPHVQTGYSRDNFDRLCQMDGIRLDELGSFKKAAGGWIEGRMLGLDVALCDYRQLERMPLPADSLIDIDIDFFVALPGEEAWVDPRAVFEVLRRLPATPPFVTIARSVESGFTPLRYRFFADYLAALWEERPGDSDHYERLYHLDCRLRAGEREAVLADSRQESESHPNCAATWYLLSLAEKDRERAAIFQSQAASISAAYRPNLLRSVCAIRSRRIATSLAEVRALQNQADNALLNSADRWLIEVEFGLIYAAFGQQAAAVNCYRRATRLGGDHPELALEVAKLFMESGQRVPAVPLLRKGLEDDKTRTAARLLLAQIDLTQGLLEEARQHLEQASAIAPAWGQLLDLLASVYQRLGNTAQAQLFRDRHEHIRRQNDQLPGQLGPT
jgi:tetratricopeptide (TPR) repeat protein